MTPLATLLAERLRHIEHVPLTNDEHRLVRAHMLELGNLPTDSNYQNYVAYVCDGIRMGKKLEANQTKPITDQLVNLVTAVESVKKSLEWYANVHGQRFDIPQEIHHALAIELPDELDQALASLRKLVGEG